MGSIRRIHDEPVDAVFAFGPDADERPRYVLRDERESLVFRVVLIGYLGVAGALTAWVAHSADERVDVLAIPANEPPIAEPAPRLIPHQGPPARVPDQRVLAVAPLTIDVRVSGTRAPRAGGSRPRARAAADKDPLAVLPVPGAYEPARLPELSDDPMGDMHPSTNEPTPTVEPGTVEAE